MNRSLLTGQKLVAVFLLGCVLLNYPILYLFNSPRTILGIPVLFAYIFGAWGALIGLMTYAIEKRGEPR